MPIRDIGGVSADRFFACGINGSAYRIEQGTVTRLLPFQGTVAGLLTVWGLDSERVYVAGQAGTVLARQGTGWRSMHQTDDRTIRELWGANGNAIFAAAQDRILRFNGNLWRVDYVETDTSDADSLASYVTIWGRNPHDVYAAGAGGKLIHYDGTSWEKMDAGTEKHIGAVRGLTDGNLYIAGQDGMIMEYDGATWRELYSRVGWDFFALLVRGPSRIFAVGDSGCVAHYNGVSWKGSASVTGGAYGLSSIWGIRSNEIFAVGEGGTIVFYDGARWFNLSSGTAQTLYGIWGEDRNSFFVVGAAGTILKYDVTYID
jgi:photosystem II stability/assembly factor-like uncharacterized protein